MQIMEMKLNTSNIDWQKVVEMLKIVGMGYHTPEIHQKAFENIMHVIGEKLDGIKDAITGGNQNQNGGTTGGSNGGTTGGEGTVNLICSKLMPKFMKKIF